MKWALVKVEGSLSEDFLVRLMVIDDGEWRRGRALYIEGASSGIPFSIRLHRSSKQCVSPLFILAQALSREGGRGSFGNEYEKILCKPHRITLLKYLLELEFQDIYLVRLIRAKKSTDMWR